LRPCPGSPEPRKAPEGWVEFFTQAGIDKDTLPSRVDHQRVVHDLDHRPHEVCLQYRIDFSFSGVRSEDRPDRQPTIAIRDHRRLEVADLEAKEAIAVQAFRAGRTGAHRMGPRRRQGCGLRFRTKRYSFDTSIWGASASWTFAKSSPGNWGLRCCFLGGVCCAP
jgi:hypothetical protein